MSNFAFAASVNCEDWFSKLKLKSGCLNKCVIAPVSMANFACHSECDELCKQNDSGLSYSLLKKYGLTDDEIKICNFENIT